MPAGCFSVLFSRHHAYAAVPHTIKKKWFAVHLPLTVRGSAPGLRMHTEYRASQTCTNIEHFQEHGGRRRITKRGSADSDFPKRRLTLHIRYRAAVSTGHLTHIRISHFSRNMAGVAESQSEEVRRQQELPEKTTDSTHEVSSNSERSRATTL